MNSDRPSPAHLRCRKCREWKLRKVFRIKERGVYDMYCSPCRSAVLKNGSTNLRVLENRVLAGRMTMEELEAIKKRKRENQSLAPTMGLHRYHLRKRIESWRTPLDSARLALKVVRKHDYPSHEAQEWGREMEAFIKEVIADMKERRRQERLPTDTRVLWYDAVSGLTVKLRRMIAEYPEGAMRCPIQVF